jgi:hypothetical protein
MPVSGRVRAVAVLALVALLTACGRVQESGRVSTASDRLPTQGGGVGSLWTRPPEGTCDCHANDYQTLEELVTESELILVGTVGESRVADVMDKNSDYPTRIIHTEVVVDEVLKGSVSGEIIVATQELAFGGPGVEEWRQAGHRVVLFLTQSLEKIGVYVPSNLSYFQAAYSVTGEDLEITVASGADVTRLNHRVAAMPLSELREKVEALQT